MIKNIPIFTMSNHRITFKIFASIFLISIFLLSSCASAPVSPNTDNSTKIEIPNLFLNPQEKYPNNIYVSAVGSGRVLGDAQKNALSGISQQIKVEISSDETLQEKIQQTENNNKISNVDVSISLESSVSTQTTQQLLGVQYGETFTTADGNVYAIAFIHRITVGNIYKQKIDERNAQITQLLKSAQTLANPFSKYVKIANAIDISKLNDEDVQVLTIIAPAMAKIAQPSTGTDTTALQIELKKVIKGVNLATETNVYGVGENESRELENTVIDSFLKLGFSINDYSISSLPYITTTTVRFNEEESGKYIVINWKLNIKITNPTNQAVLFSYSGTDKTRGKNKSSALELALFDVKKALHAEEIYKILAQSN